MVLITLHKALLDRTRSDLSDTRKSQAEAQSAAHAETLEREVCMLHYRARLSFKLMNPLLLDSGKRRTA
jgi:hypothetical protein